MSLSVVIIAKNEQDLIETCLKSCNFADEIIVIDNDSTDKTADIAKKHGARVISYGSEDFSKTRNRGMESAKSDWVLYIDADERILKDLELEILEAINTPGISALAISRKNIIFGQPVNYGPYKKDWVIRLFKKSDFDTWVGKVHEYGKFRGELGYSKNSLLHLTHRDLDHFMQKTLVWSKIDAKLRYDANHPGMTKLRFMRILFTSFWNELITRRGFFGGTVGFIDSTLQAISFYLTYIRLWEMQQKPLAEIYKDIDKKLIENNFEYKQ